MSSSFIEPELKTLKPFMISPDLVNISNRSITDKYGGKYKLLSFSNIQVLIPEKKKQIKIMEKLYYGWAQSGVKTSNINLPFTPVCQEDYHLFNRNGTKIYNLYPQSKKNSRENTARKMNKAFTCSIGSECFWIINQFNIAVGLVFSKIDDPNDNSSDIQISIAIYPPWRRRNLAARSTIELLKELRDKGLLLSNQVFVEVKEGNFISCRIIERVGFELSEKQPLNEQGFRRYYLIPDKFNSNFP